MTGSSSRAANPQECEGNAAGGACAATRGDDAARSIQIDLAERGKSAAQEDAECDGVALGVMDEDELSDLLEELDEIDGYEEPELVDADEPGTKDHPGPAPIDHLHALFANVLGADPRVAPCDFGVYVSKRGDGVDGTGIGLSLETEDGCPFQPMCPGEIDPEARAVRIALALEPTLLGIRAAVSSHEDAVIFGGGRVSTLANHQRIVMISALRSRLLEAGLTNRHAEMLFSLDEAAHDAAIQYRVHGPADSSETTDASDER